MGDNKKLLFICFLGMFIFSFANVSAFLDVKDFNKDVGKYGQIEIDDWLFLNKVDYKLTDYGNSVINAWAEGEYTLHKKTHLFTGVFYKDIIGGKGELKNVKFYIWENKTETRYNPIYENQNCYMDYNFTDDTIDKTLPIEYLINDTGREICDRVLISNKSYEVDVTGWTDYKKGMNLEEGEGKWKIEADKPANQKVDFVLEAHGKEFTEWAWWNSSWNYKVPINISENSGDIREDRPLEYFINFTANGLTEPTSCSKEIRVLNFNEDLEFEREVYNEVYSGGKCQSATIFWFGNLTANINNTFYIYYDNSETNNPTSGYSTDISISLADKSISNTQLLVNWYSTTDIWITYLEDKINQPGVDILEEGDQGRGFQYFGQHYNFYTGTISLKEDRKLFKSVEYVRAADPAMNIKITFFKDKDYMLYQLDPGKDDPNHCLWNAQPQFCHTSALVGKYSPSWDGTLISGTNANWDLTWWGLNYTGYPNVAFAHVVVGAYQNDTYNATISDPGAGCFFPKVMTSKATYSNWEYDDFKTYISTGATGNIETFANDSYNNLKDDLVYILGAEEISPFANNPPTITANITKPDIVNQNTDYLVNLTIEDVDIGDTLTGYAQYYVNGTAVDIEQSAVAVNGTTTLIGTLSYGNFSGGDNLTAQVWAGDGTANTTKVYLVSSIVTSPPSVTNLIEFPADPATYSLETIYHFNATVTDNGILDDVILEFNGTNYTATNISADIFNVSLTNLSVGTYNYRWFANDSEGIINNTETGSYTIDKAIPEGNLTSTLGWTINESQEVIIGLSETNGGDDDVVYIVHRDDVEKGTGETWSPAYGTYNYVLNTTGGANWTENISMDTQTLTVKDNINPNIEINYPVNGSSYSSIITELNYTANDTNLNSCWYSLNNGTTNTTITCGDNVTGLNSGDGTSTWQVWVNDSDNNINTTTTTFFVDSVSPSVVDLVEFPTDPATYSLETVYHFNATITDISSSLDDIIFEFNGTNYTATNISADIFNVSFTNLSAGTYNYRWFANDTAGNINNSVTGDYTIDKATSQTSLTFDIASPQTYGTAITSTCSVTVGDGPAILDFDGQVMASGTPKVIGAGVILFNCSYAENANYTGNLNVSSYTINKAIPIGSLTSNLGWNINEGQTVTIGLSESQSGDDDVTYIVHRDNVEKGTGETWTPAYGIYNYLLNTTGGANWTENTTMNYVSLNVSDNINPNIAIVFPSNNTLYGLIITELNYTVNDTNINSCWYSLNNGSTNTSVTCGNNVIGLNSGEGISTWQVWVNDSDNNINTTTVTFTVDTTSPNMTNMTEYPTDPANYSVDKVYHFNITVIDANTLDAILLEFNGTNYSTSNIGNIFNVSFTKLSAGTYNYRWFANDSLGHFNNTETGSYTIDKAIPALGLTATTPITYGTATDFSGSGCPAELSCSLDISNNVYAVGNITGNYSTAGNANYTSAYVNFTVTINKAVLTGTISGTTPITYGTPGDVQGAETNNNDSDVVYKLFRDDVEVSNPDITTLAAGTYDYIYNSTGGENYTLNPSIDTFTLTVDKETGQVYAYVGNKREAYLGNNLTSKNEYLNGSLNVGVGDIKMYLNNSLINSGSPPLFSIMDLPLGSYYFNVTYDGNDNYTADEEHWGVNVSVWFLSNLTGVFSLNADTGDIAYDISGNNNNGTIEEATWGSDNIDVTLTDGVDFIITNTTGEFDIINNIRDKTWIDVSYTYYEYDSGFLAGAIMKILPGLLIMLTLIMIFKLFVKPRFDQVEDNTYNFSEYER